MKHKTKMKTLWIVLAIAISLVAILMSTGCEVLKKKSSNKVDSSTSKNINAGGTDTTKAKTKTNEAYTREIYNYLPDSNLMKLLMAKDVKPPFINTPVQIIRESGTKETVTDFERFMAWYMMQKDTTSTKVVAVESSKETNWFKPIHLIALVAAIILIPPLINRISFKK